METDTGYSVSVPAQLDAGLRRSRLQDVYDIVASGGGDVFSVVAPGDCWRILRRIGGIFRFGSKTRFVLPTCFRPAQDVYFPQLSQQSQVVSVAGETCRDNVPK